MPKHEGYIEKLSKGPATSSHFVLVGIEITFIPLNMFLPILKINICIYNIYIFINPSFCFVTQ